MRRGICYSSGGWLAAIMRVSSVEDETGERQGLGTRKTDSVSLCLW